MQSRYKIDGGYELVFQPDCAKLRQDGLSVTSSRDKFAGIGSDLERVRYLHA